MKQNNQAIILTGGGTAGHVWPHFSLFEGNDSPLAQAFHRHQLDVHYVGSQTGMEKDLVLSTQPTWQYHSISTGKLRRYFSLKNFIDPFKIILGIIQSFILVKNIKPGVVFSKGGFVSAPVVWAAWLCRVPVVIHESDATPALATKLTLFCAEKILLSFSETIEKIPSYFRKKVLVSGLPIRESLFEEAKKTGVAHFNLNESRKTILVFGGSLGAQSLNQKIFQLVPELIQNYNVIHLTGKGNKAKDISMKLQNTPITSGCYVQLEFLKEDMKYAYAAADLAICRAGASSIFELAAARIPMILVPLGLHASRGDQIVNAKIFANKGWAECIDEYRFDPHEMLSLIKNVMRDLPNKRNALNSAPSKNSAVKISEILWEFLCKR